MAEYKKCSLGKGGREDLASSCNMDRVELDLPVSAKLKKSQKIMGKRILGENYYTGKDEQEFDNIPKQNYFLYFKCHNFSGKIKPRDKAQAKKILECSCIFHFWILIALSPE